MTQASEVGSSRNQYIAAFAVNLLAFGHGCAVGWLSPLLPLLMSDNSPVGEPLSMEMGGWIASVNCITGALGTPIFGMLADKVGRKTSIMISAIPYELSWLLMLFWRDPVSILIGRILAGCGAAGIFMLTSQYAAEIASRETRGLLGSLMIFSINGGIIFMYIFQAYMDYEIVVLTLSFVPITAFLLLWKMPETPPFLVKMGRIEEAIKSLAWLRGVPEDASLVKEELTSLKYDIDIADSPNKSSNTSNPPILPGEVEKDLKNVPEWKQFFNFKPTRRAFALAFILLTLQCFTGIYAINTYGSQIFSETGSSLSPNDAVIILGVIQFIGSVIASSLIEKLGRKLLLVSTSLLMSMCLTIMATYLYLKQLGFDMSSYNVLPIVTLSLAVCVFATGLGPIPYVLLSELFIVQARGMVNSILLVWVWIASFIVTKVYLPTVDLFGITTVFYFFAAISLAEGAIALRYLPETKGKPLNEIVTFFEGKKSGKKQSSGGQKLECHIETK